MRGEYYLGVGEASGPHGRLHRDLLDDGKIEQTDLEMLPELCVQDLQCVRLYHDATVEGAE